MPELLTLTSPISLPSITNYRMVCIDLDMDAQVVLLIALSDTGQRTERLERGVVAVNLMHTLNTADLSIKSLQRRGIRVYSIEG